MTNSRPIFPIVGIGASAGGLDSLKRLFKRIPKESGMAYVVVQHLHPSHDSRLAEILSRTTQVPVQEIVDGVQLEPDHIFVIPKNTLLEVEDQSFKLFSRDEKAQNLPIDFFFSSLAETHKTQAIGVVLSGTGHDGTIGLTEIKQHGGITFAEDKSSAAFEGMPQSAVDHGVVDFVLTPQDISDKLLKLNSVSQNAQLLEGDKLPKGQDDHYRQILSIIGLYSGIDFNHYKQPTIHRRIAKRMVINQINSLGDYLEFLSGHRAEQESLYQDMLIKVSSFFREPKTFETLVQSVFPVLFEKKSEASQPIRIWVAGCATGEEAYSLAICLHQLIAKRTDGDGSITRKVQIFASDISETAILKAREGIYSHTELHSLSKEVRTTFFSEINHQYKVKNEIRENIVFARHNFLKDPPFAKMDLISCRNVFIYMDAFLQKTALAAFHYALVDHGFLVLGEAESANASHNLFTSLSKQEKIYKRKPGDGRFMLPQSQPKSELKTNKDKVPPLLKAPRPDFIKSAESVLLLRHTPPGVIIDEHMEVVYFNGVLEPYLGHPPNQPTFNIFRLVHNSLEFELRNALLKAKNLQTVVMKEDIPLLVNGERWLTTLEIIPLTDTAATHYLLLFQKKSQPYSFWKKIWKKLSKVQANIGNGQAKLRVKILEKEYEQLRENMRTLSEDQEATNEELQSANEELLSGNEELQTLNEELETSTEELQSTNEELTVVNQQLEDKQNQLQIALIYTEAIVATLREPLVVLNRDFNIEMANTAFYKKFHVNEQEIKGKSLFDIQGGHWKKPELESLLENVLPEKEAIMDYELRLDLPPYGLRNLLLNASEIVSEHQPNKLILFAIEDITERKQAAEKQKSLLDELRHVNQQLEQFVNVTSHDLQEPLRKILIFSERLRTKAKGQLTEETETYLQKIELSSKRMTELIKGLLKYSRLTDYEKLFEPTDLNECVKVALGDLEHVIEQKKADIQISDLPTIEVIPLQMNQLFYNLISNALKFSKKDILPKIGISSRKLSEKEVEIIIKDNGIGFDQKYEEQIFKAFQRLDQPLKQKGTGIGLALVKRVVENHRGMIHATSKEGEGTTFQVQLPVKQPD